MLYYAPTFERKDKYFPTNLPSAGAPRGNPFAVSLRSRVSSADVRAGALEMGSYRGGIKMTNGHQLGS